MKMKKLLLLFCSLLTTLGAWAVTLDGKYVSGTGRAVQNLESLTEGYYAIFNANSERYGYLTYNSSNIGYDHNMTDGTTITSTDYAIYVAPDGSGNYTFRLPNDKYIPAVSRGSSMSASAASATATSFVVSVADASASTFNIKNTSNDQYWNANGPASFNPLCGWDEGHPIKFYPLGIVESTELSKIQSDVTIADFSNLPTTYGAFSDDYYTFTTNDASGVAGLTITVPNSDVTMGSQYVNGTYGNCYRFVTSDYGSENAHNVVITAPSGYVITGYSMTMRSNTAQANFVVTPNGGSAVTSSTGGTVLSQTGLSASSVALSMYTQNKANTLFIPYFGVTLRKVLSIDYHVLDANGTEVDNTDSGVSHKSGDIPALSSPKSYCTYTYYSDAACTTELPYLTLTSTDVYVKYTYTSPFPFETADSYSAISKWYCLRIRPASGYNNYIKYVSGSTPNVAMTTDGYTTVAKAQQWAFVGTTDPYTGTGLTIYNRAAGSSLILASNTPEGDGGSTYATMEATGAKTYQVWFAENNSSVEGGFFLKTADNHYLNRRSTANLAFWTGGHDIGSTFSVVEVPDNYASQVVSDIQPWYDAESGYFNLTATAKSALEDAGYTAALTSCDLDTYNTLKAIVDNSSNFSYPETGYFRIKSSGQRIGESYIGYGQPTNWSAGLITVTATVAKADASTVLLLTKSADKNNSYTISTQGMTVKPQTTANVAFPCSTDGDAATFSFTIISPGVVGIYNAASHQNDNVAGYLHESGWGVPGVVNWKTDGSTASHWTVEDASTISLALNEVNGTYYGTTCLPYAIALNGGGKAYNLTLGSSKEYVTIDDGSYEIAAGTPVMLKSTTVDTLTAWVGYSSIYPVVQDLTYAATPVTTGLLQGTYTALTSNGASYLVLNKSNDKVGFYNLGDGSTLKPNRAYIPYGWVAASGIKGFYLWSDDDLTDGISQLEGELQGAPVYDLSGRKVSDSYGKRQLPKGLYIVNGKKVMVK